MALVADYRFNDDVLKKFWDRVEVNKPDECWPYTGRLVSGYGLFAVRRVRDRDEPKPDGSMAYWGAIMAHRIALWSLTGTEPGESVDHLCHTSDLDCEGGKECLHRRCCNPAHLEPVSVAENARRRLGRYKKECKYGHPLSGENLYIYEDSTGRISRQCRVCVKRRNDETNAKQKAARAANPAQPKRVTCPVCLLDFTRPAGNRRKYCSDECAGDVGRKRSLENGRRLRKADPEAYRRRQREYYHKGKPAQLDEFEALARPCPTCGAPEGDACLNRKYQPTTRIHPERRQQTDV